MTACRKRSDKTSLTLKCRHGDLYFVQSRVVIAEDARLEEDLKPRFAHLFSYSRKAEGDAPKDVDALIDLFPDMKNCMGEPPAGSSFELVRDFVAIERIYSGLKVELSESFDAECAVVVWYDRNIEDDETPVVIETRPACGGGGADHTLHRGWRGDRVAAPDTGQSPAPAIVRIISACSPGLFPGSPITSWRCIPRFWQLPVVMV